MDSLASHIQWGDMLYFFLRIAAVLICIIVHELSHGLTAYYLGDQTAKKMNRLSLNPIRHIDPIGALMMISVGFGWAKPVPVDMRYFKNPKLGMAITAFAGPFSNFILAFITAILLQIVISVQYIYGSFNTTVLIDFLQMLLVLNIGLGLFNLIPFPPLDGSKIMGAILPEKIYYTLMRYEFIGMFILMGLLWMGYITTPLRYASQAVITFMLDMSEFVQQVVISLLM